MRAGAFELREPLPELREPHALAMLSPWIDVGRVGTLTLSLLESHLEADELGRLRRPGLFYDFTRYRPLLYQAEGRRQIEIPNTLITCARRKQGNDLVFLHCMEPHMLGETYADSVLNVLEKLGVKRYCTLGAMYDSVPHTRSLIVTGNASGTGVERELRALGVGASGYQGPTSIYILISNQAPERGIETMTMVAHLPHYAQLEEDSNGEYALLSLISSLYNLPLDLDEVKRKGEEQYRKVGLAVARDRRIQDIVKEMEESYDARQAEEQGTGGMQPLSPEIQKFLREIDKRFGSN